MILPKNRKEQYKHFNKMVILLLQYAEFQNITIRLGEAHRTLYQAKSNLKWGTSKTLYSKHRYSLAIDIWITKPYKGRPGKDIEWSHQRYIVLGKFWKYLGGTWGGLKEYGGDFNSLNDPYHFEVKGRVL